MNESEMPDQLFSGFERLTDGIEYYARCADCGQHWHFYLSGRHDIPTYEKLEVSDARRRIAAWHAAKPEREAIIALRAEEDRQRDAGLEIEQAKYLDAKAREQSPFSRFIRYAAMALIFAGALLGLKMVMTGGDPLPQSLALAGGAYLSAMALAGWFLWHTRIR